MVKSALCIINRKSSRGGRDISGHLDRLREAGFRLDVRPTETPQDIPGMIERAASSTDVVLVGGGDGTLNTAARPLMEAGLPLGILPLGTANDLAASLGIGSRMDRAVDALIHDQPVAINVGTVNHTHFLNTAHLGMSVHMIRGLSAKDKKRLGFLVYMVKVARSFFQTRPFPVRITCDGRVHQTQAIEVAVGNGVKYGGGLTFPKDASHTRDDLCCYVIQPLGALELIAKIPSFYAGTLEGKARIVFLRGQRIRVETADGQTIMADGEMVSQEPGDFGFLPKALRVFVPSAYAAGLSGRGR